MRVGDLKQRIAVDQFLELAVASPGGSKIAEFLGGVRLDPAQSWPLRDAARMVGASDPFQFSKDCKSVIGIGFHEYVDRCRTELAVTMLAETDHAIDFIASTCGFGTTQGLREALKEYVGVTPQTLRESLQQNTG
jgi:AraC-like DNA-binding protein